MVLSLQAQCQFARHGCLTGTVQTSHQNHRGATRQIQFSGFSAHEFCQLVVHNLDHHLARLHRSQHILTQRLLLHRVGKRLSHLIVHVGFEKCLTHILQRFRHVDFGDFAFTLQYLERPFQSLAQIFKHIFSFTILQCTMYNLPFGLLALTF